VVSAVDAIATRHVLRAQLVRTAKIRKAASLVRHLDQASLGHLVLLAKIRLLKTSNFQIRRAKA
jgi:hypothetical protein